MKVIERDASGQPTMMDITRPDDWHLHLRDGAGMYDILRYTTRVFGRAIVMPNLKPPVTTVEAAWEYRARILRFIERQGVGMGFEPLMTLYLTENMLPAEIIRARQSGFIHGVKYYPAGATTNSDAGVHDLRNVERVLRTMEEVDLPLLLHGEVADPETSVFQREDAFVSSRLEWLYTKFPKLRIVLEHITTWRSVKAVQEAPATVAATITPQHLLYWLNHLLGDGIRPHLYCKPVLKGYDDRALLVAAATSRNQKFFLGSDSAPHALHTKEASCGCAGCFTAPIAMSLYAKAFESVGRLDTLEGFASHHGAKFYCLPRNEGTIRLVRKPWQVPETYPFGDSTVVPPCAGETLDWQVVEA